MFTSSALLNDGSPPLGYVSKEDKQKRYRVIEQLQRARPPYEIVGFAVTALTHREVPQNGGSFRGHPGKDIPWVR